MKETLADAMAGKVALSDAEMAVLRCALDQEYYQPSAGAKPVADRLYDRGLLEPHPSWPDVTVATLEGEQAYREATRDEAD